MQGESIEGSSGNLISSLTLVVCGTRLPWNEIQGQRQRNHTRSKHGGAAEGRPAIVTICSLALALDFIPWQLITQNY